MLKGKKVPAAARVVSVASKMHLLATCVPTAPSVKFSALRAYNESKLAQVASSSCTACCTLLLSGNSSQSRSSRSDKAARIAHAGTKHAEPASMQQGRCSSQQGWAAMVCRCAAAASCTISEQLCGSATLDRLYPLQVQFMAQLRRRKLTRGVAFFSVDPGETFTDIVRNNWMAPLYRATMCWILITPQQGSPLAGLLLFNVQLAAKSCSCCSSSRAGWLEGAPSHVSQLPSAGARSALHCASSSVSQLPAVDDPASSYYGSACRPVATPATEDAKAGLELWQWSAQQVDHADTR